MSFALFGTVAAVLVAAGVLCIVAPSLSDNILGNGANNTANDGSQNLEHFPTIRPDKLQGNASSSFLDNLEDFPTLSPDKV
jgi:hypothetical protein